MSFPPALAGNPLVNPPPLSYGAPAWDKIKTEHFLPAIRWALEQAQAELDAIRAIPVDQADFANTIEALAFSGDDLQRIAKIFGVITGSLSNKEVRAVQKEVDALLVKFDNDVLLDAALFARVQHVNNSPAAAALQGPRRTLLEKTYNNFARNGALLANPADKDKLRQIDETLKKLTADYQNNITEAEAAYEMVIDDVSQLDGVPASTLAVLAKNAEDRNKPGKWVVTPGYELPIYKYCRNFALSEKIFNDINSLTTTPPHDNGPLVIEILKTRHEKAVLLGKNNWAELILEDRMAKDAATVENFEREALAVYQPAAKTELQKIRDLALREGIADPQPWHITYYNRMLQEQTYSVDMEEVKSYFDLDKVVEGARLHEKKFFGTEMVEAGDKYPVWDPKVKVYEVQKAGQTIALFYADYFIRQDEAQGQKRTGAWMDEIRTRGVHQGRDQIPIIGNWYNFEEPPPGQPALLNMRDSSTVFHERGHGTQGINAQGRYPGLNGTNVAWDFVELASQFNENFFREKEVLKTFAVNAGGQAIPDALVDKVVAMNNYGAGMMGQRQVFLGLLDIELHTADPAQFNTPADLYAFEDRIRAEVGMAPRVSGPMVSDFHHLFADPVGYSSGYYSYKWAEGLEADAFITRFKKLTDIYNQKAAGEYTSMIAAGSNRPADTIYEEFMGRGPDWNPMFERQGLSKVSPPPPPAPG